MNTTIRQSVRRRGAALVLAVVVSVLLAVVGVMFVMVARVGEMQTAAVIDNADLDTAVQSVSARIQQTLTDDLFRGGDTIGNGSPHYTWPGVKKGGDPAADERISRWLAALEPNSANSFKWDFISNLSDPTILPSITDRQVDSQIVVDYQPSVSQGTMADADGDGVADSMWIQIPDTFTSRGKPVYAAVRIIDNCAMLNLNTAFGFYQQANATPWHSKSWYASEPHLLANLPYATNGDYGKALGKYLSEINYAPFLRGDDRNHIEYLMLARDPIRLPLKPAPLALLPDIFHNEIILNIDSPGSDFTLFDFSDELEMRNRFLLTSLTQSRFERENVAYNTFDWKRGEFAGGWKVALKVKRIPYDAKSDDDDEDLTMWRTRLNPANFDDTGNPAPTNPFYYDRRHISTFYSFDRPLRTGVYPLLEAEVADEDERAKLMPDKAKPIDLRTADLSSDPAAIVHLLYAMREAFGNAKEAAQCVVNLMDYIDADNDVTAMNESMFDGYIAAIGGTTTAATFGFDPGEVFYGYERQPFISEVYSFNDGTGVKEFALELINPYGDAMNLKDWNIQVGMQANVLDASYIIPAAAAGVPGRMVIYSGPIAGFAAVASDKQRVGFGLGTPMNAVDGVLRLQRPDPLNAGQYLTVDAITDTERLHLITTTVSPFFKSTCRDDTGWKFANRSAYTTRDSVQTLGQSNGVGSDLIGYSLPVANSGKMERLADFLKVAVIGNQKGGATPKTITQQIADAADESEIRFDIETAPQVLDYVCFLNRPQGSLPGRININTAAKHVIAAAIPPQLVMTATGEENALTLAQKIVDNRPYKRVSDLLNIAEFKKFITQPENVGDPLIDNDFEERDWIVSRLANIFTVRSDTFTAYILVRLGADGPQRRMIAVFDRTNVWTKDDRPRLVALHPVPDPR